MTHTHGNTESRKMHYCLLQKLFAYQLAPEADTVEMTMKTSSRYGTTPESQKKKLN